MPQPIPSYLIALAVGDLAFRELGPRSGVYAEPAVVEAAAWEFADTEAMIAAAEQLYGPYRWGRYDLLVLPPSFPFGGMENPRLTFATPTILAGDRVAGLAGRSRAGALVVGQPGDQRDLERLLAQRRVHHLLRAPHHGGALRPRPGREPGAAVASRARAGDRAARAAQRRHPSRALARRPRPRRGHDAGGLRQGLSLPALDRGERRSRALGRLPRAVLRSLRVPVDDHRAVPGVARAGSVGEVRWHDSRVAARERMDLRAGPPLERSTAALRRLRARRRRGGALARGRACLLARGRGLEHAGPASTSSSSCRAIRPLRSSASSTRRSA